MTTLTDQLQASTSFASARSPQPPPREGLIEDASADDYFSWAAVNASTLKTVRKATLAHVHHYLSISDEMDRRSRTPAAQAALDFGTAYHAMVLEPGRFKDNLLGYEKKPRAGSSARADFDGWLIQKKKDGKIVMPVHDAERLRAMYDVLISSNTVRNILFAEGTNEVSAVWTRRAAEGTENAHPVACKARIDRIIPAVGLVDFKTTAFTPVPTSDDFLWQIYRLGYHWSAYWYREAFRRLLRRDYPHVIVAQEKKPPYLVAVINLDDEWLQVGGIEAGEAFEAIAEAVRTGEWPGVEDRVHEAPLLEPIARRYQIGTDLTGAHVRTPVDPVFMGDDGADEQPDFGTQTTQGGNVTA